VSELAVDGVLSAAEIQLTAERLAELQLPNGMIAWYPGGHADPWNHVEAAMALAVAGNVSAAERAYQWLVDIQREDGAWHQYYLANNVIEQDKLDANCAAYIATGAWHHYLLTRDRGSSICHSLRCAVAIARELGHERPQWEESMIRLADVIRNDPSAFAPKDRWAMDWYYPVLCGAITGEAGRERLARGVDTFIMLGKGVRCVSDRPWVTAAETCEAVLAYLSVGDRAMAMDLFQWSQAARTDRGDYFTGTVYPQVVTFPADERSSYTSAAVILAADALSEHSPASRLLSDHAGLPELVLVDEAH